MRATRLWLIFVALIVVATGLARQAAHKAISSRAPVPASVTHSAAAALGAPTIVQGPALTPELNRQLIDTLKAQEAYYKNASRPSGGGAVWATPVVSALAALVAFFTLLVNYRFNQQTKQDNQFYEALERFGEKDSPAVRVSAAVLLSSMARPRQTGALATWLSRLVRRKDLGAMPSPYLSTVLQQFTAGMMLEPMSSFERQFKLSSLR